MKSLPHLSVLLLLAAMLPLSSSHGQRQMEKLGRGVVALRSSSTQVHISWRLLGNDPEDVAFNLYRSANGSAPAKINPNPLTATTDYTDTPLNLGSTAYAYSVRPVRNGVEVPDIWANTTSGSFSLPANPPTRRYVPVPLQPTPDDASAGVSYTVKFCWVGDFDGDGEYDFLVDRSNPNVEAKQWLQAYKRDGTLLWQMDMGPNSVDHYHITPGSSAIGIGHGDNVTVYDLDGDGQAEAIVRTANGVVFKHGTAGQTTLTAPNDEVQYLSIIDGLTGQEEARAPIPLPPEWETQTHMNGQMGIVYADGLSPSVFFKTSNRNPDGGFNHEATTWDYRNGQLTQRWNWPFTGHTAEGHQLRFADVNNDGRDEYCDVGHVLKADGSGQINENVLTDVGHGDRFHITDINPDRPGLETFIIQQDNATGLLTAYFTSDKSAILKKQYSPSVTDVGRGTVGAFVPNLFGLQFFSTAGGVYDHTGNELYNDAPFPPETIWWDGSLDREFVATIGGDATSPGIDRFNPANPSSPSRVLTIYTDDNAPGAPYNNYIAYGGRPQFWGDILGDWREELVCVASDNSELRIYSARAADTPKTSGNTPLRIYTLMHNPQYRIQATAKGYVQSSYVDYYLGYGMTPPPPPPMVDARLVWKGGVGASTWDAASPSWTASGAPGVFVNGDTVRFDLGSDDTLPVTLTGLLQPGAVTVYSPEDFTFAGAGSLAGPMALTKAGAGVLTVSGTHIYTGKTTVWDGALALNGRLQNSPVTVWGGAWGGAAARGVTGGRVAGTGRFDQPVTIKYRGAVTPGSGMGNSGTLNFFGGLASEGGAVFALDVSDAPAKPHDRIAVTGTLSLTGTTTVVLNPLSGTLAPGTYSLITYGTLSGSTGNLSVVVPPGTPYTLSSDSGSIRITVPVTRAAAAVTWRGSGTNWDLAASQNWLRGGSPDFFVAGDTVAFDATGAASPNVHLSTELPVAGVTVHSSGDYTFTGTGSISGAGGLTKSGTGTLTVDTSNGYAGPTQIHGGVLAVHALGPAGSPGAIGASSAQAANLVLDSGTLRLTGPPTYTDRSLILGVSGGGFDIPASRSLQISGTVTGTGALIKTGAGSLILASANTYAGGTVINGGRVYLAGKVPNVSGLGAGTVTIQSGTLSMANVQASETAAWNLVVPSGATARLDADGRCSLTGSLTGAGDLTFHSPYIRTDLKGNWSAFTGRIFAIGSDSDFRITNSHGFGTAALDLGDGIFAFYNVSMGSNHTVGIGQLSGAATSFLRGGLTAGRTVTWQIGSRNSDSTYGGTIGNNTGPSALTKVGTGVLTLTGTSTYTGPTTVSAGNLVLKNGSLAGTSVNVAQGTGFGGNGTVTGNVTFATGSTLLVNPAAGPLAILGDVIFGGAITISPVPGAILTGGRFPFLTYTGQMIGTPVFTWIGRGFSATFDTSVPGEIGLVMTELPREPADVVWTATNSSEWDATTKNWVWSGGPTAFVAGDRVLFDDTAASADVTLVGTLAPESLTFSATRKYSLVGGGVISGTASLAQSGAGELAISGSHTFSGGSLVTSGTVTLQNAAANANGLGTGPVKIHGGTVKLFSLGGSSTSAGTFDNPLQVGAGLTGTLIGFGRGSLASALTGSGILNYQTDYVRADITGNWSAFTGRINVTRGPNGGDFRINNTNGFGTAKINLASGVLMYMQVNFGSTLTNTIGELTGSGELRGGPTSGRTMTWNVGGANTSATFSGSIKNATGPTAITKSGTGTWILSGLSTYTGTTTISGGTLLVTGTLGTTPISVGSGAACGGTGTVGGNLTLASGARLVLGVGGTTTRGLTVSGTTTLTGSITVVPALLGGLLAPGSHTLLTYSGSLGGSPTFTWNDTTLSGYLATFTTATPGQVTITLTQPSTPPSAPSGLHASPGNAQVNLAWDSVSGVTDYTVLRSTTSGSGYAVVASSLTSNSFTDTGLTNGTSYYYVVVASNGTGSSGNSNQAAAKPVQSYSEWVAVAFPGEFDPSIIGLAADPDNDGYLNLMEYFQATSPGNATPNGTSTCALDAQGNIVLTFRMSKNLSNVSYTVQRSWDMSTWEDVHVTPAVVNDQSAYYVMNATIPQGTNSRLFVRLIVTAN